MSPRLRFALFPALALPFIAPLPLVAQGTGTTAPRAAARPADVATPDAILAALYDVISGPANTPRDWHRFRSLFVDGAHLIPTGVAQDGTGRHSMLTVEDYATRIGPRLEQSGFFEREVARQWEQFGNIAHAFSTYESRRAANDAEPFARGINSIQLFHDGTRWWIVNIFWDAERPGLSIPARYLP